MPPVNPWLYISWNMYSWIQVWRPRDAHFSCRDLRPHILHPTSMSGRECIRVHFTHQMSRNPLLQLILHGASLDTKIFRKPRMLCSRRNFSQNWLARWPWMLETVLGYRLELWGSPSQELRSPQINLGWGEEQGSRHRARKVESCSHMFTIKLEVFSARCS